MERGARRLELPDLRRARQGRLRAGRGSGLTTTPYTEATRDLLHARVLDAVGELLADRPWSRVTMSAVAERAGVSRQTLYNAFGARPELAEAYVAREAERFLDAVDIAIAANAREPRAALAGALEVFLAAAETHPLVRAVVSPDGGEELLPLVTTRGGPLVDQVTGHLAARLVETWPDLPAADARLVSDTLVRLAISHAALPAGPPAETAEALARILGPSVDGLIGGNDPG